MWPHSDGKWDQEHLRLDWDAGRAEPASLSIVSEPHQFVEFLHQDGQITYMVPQGSGKSKDGRSQAFSSLRPETGIVSHLFVRKSQGQARGKGRVNK